ncbi:MAG: GatB/YqeY domain-containing protein [Dehalococcoidia bacterium]|nr:GatB/YqeY domain-containing protein [Dehalococcoidia bacterium]
MKRGERKRQRKGGKVLDSQEMALKDSIQEALRGALKRQQRVEVATLRLLLSEIKYAEIAQQKPADDNKVLDVITKEIKRRRESIEAFKKGNRSDLVAQEEAELAVLLSYLPEQMSRAEIMAAAQRVVDAVGAKGPSEKGKVMAQLMPQLKGKAEGKEVSEIVSELLAAR